MSLAVVVLSFNHPEITSRCVRSVLRHYSQDQTHLIHNGSNPEIIDQLKRAFPSIHHHIIEQNRGFSGGANFALHTVFEKNSDVDWCFFITNDCELIKSGELPRHPGMVAPIIHFRKAGRVDSIGGQVFAGKGHLRHLRTPEEFLSVPKEQIYIPGTAFFIARRTFEDNVGFDESLHTYWEDVEYSIRLNENGHSLQFTTEFELVHIGGKTCHKDRFYTSYLYHRNRSRVCRAQTSWKEGVGVPRAQLEMHLLVDYIKYSYRFATRAHWEDLKLLTRAYYGD